MTASPSDNDDPLLGNGLTGLLDCALDDGFNPTEPAVPEHWEPPTPAHIAVLLPQYQIEHLIGRGGMGAVYKGRQITLNRPVAIKVLPAELARNKEFVARFHREAQLLASLSHQGIVTIFDFGQTTEGHLYFVMEYVDGTDLNKLIHKQKKRLEPKEALSLTVQICEAMQYAHEKGVVHRDIKPANVLVTKDGRAKLADFGLAMKPADPDAVPEPPKPEVYFDAKHSPNVAHLRFTQPGAAMGTPDYAAPEVYEGKADERSDIYALGIMLYEMLTGAPPKGYFQLPSVMAPVDHRVDHVVVKALEIDPGARYQKVEEMKADVQAATQPLPPAPPLPPQRTQTVKQGASPPPARSRVLPPASKPTSKKQTLPFFDRVMWLMVAALVGGIGLWIWHFIQSEQGQRLKQRLTEMPAAGKDVPVMVGTNKSLPSPYPTEPAKPVESASRSKPSDAPIASSVPTPGKPTPISLFNGKDLTGWKGVSEFWSVQDGALTFKSTAAHPCKFYCTALVWQGGEVRDFELTFQARALPESAKAWRVAGLLFRGRISNPPEFGVEGYQLDIDEEHRFTGNLCEKKRSTRDFKGKRGDKVEVEDMPEAPGYRAVITGTLGDKGELAKSIRRDDWNSYRLRAVGEHIEAWVNGQKTFELWDRDNAARRSGILGLSTFYYSMMTVQYKDLMLTKLESEPNDQDSKADFEKTLRGYVWHIPSRNWFVRFDDNHEAHVQEGRESRTWHWWITGPNTLHVQFAAQPAKFDLGTGETYVFDSAMSGWVNGTGKSIGVRGQSR